MTLLYALFTAFPARQQMSVGAVEILLHVCIIYECFASGVLLFFCEVAAKRTGGCRLEGIDYVQTFQELKTKHEQNKESVSTAFAP